MRSHAAWDANNTLRSDWNFDTVKSISALGSYSGTVNGLLPSAMDNEPFDDSEVDGSIDSEVATHSSDLLGIGVTSNAAHPTVIIKAPHSPGPIDTTDDLSGTALYLASCPTLLNCYFRCVASILWISTLCSCTVRCSYVC